METRPGSSDQNPSKTTADLRESVANLRQYGERAHNLAASSIILTDQLFSDPDFLMSSINKKTDQGELLDWANSFRTMLNEKTKEFSSEKTRAQAEKNARWTRVTRGYINAHAQLNKFFSELDKWLFEECNTIRALHNMIRVIKEAVAAYMPQKFSAFKSKKLYEVIDLTQIKFDAACTIAVSSDKQSYTCTVHQKMVEKPKLFLATVNGLLKQFEHEKTFNSESLKALSTALEKYGFTVLNNAVIATSLSARSFNKRKQALMDICVNIANSIKTLRAERQKINAYQIFDDDILAKTIDALKYRRARTESKIHKLFSNDELCRQRVALLTRYITLLENGECESVSQLNTLLEQLRIANLSRRLHARVIDGHGGLNKLLEAHDLDVSDFSMFDEPCKKHRNPQQR